MRIHVVLHESFEGPGAIADWAAQNHYEMRYTRLYAGEQLPYDCTDFDFLIVMGGPQSPATTVAECGYFDAQKEIALISQAVQAKKLVLGVCLGAQLIGEAYGARFEHSPYKEIGVFPVMLTAQAQADPLFRQFPQQFLVGHWHGDMPGLTQEAIVLATSVGCPRQIVKYAPTVYGFQCHFEFTPATVAEMLKHSQAELRASQGLPYVQVSEQMNGHDYHEMNKLLFGFLDALVKVFYF